MVIQSLWTKPFWVTYCGTKEKRATAGWPHRSLNYYSWALSCLQLRKFYNDVELFTDSIGSEILIEKMKLPYTKVHIVLDESDEKSEKLWAIGKLHTYKIQSQPFLHVDSDVFIWKPFDENLMQSPLIAESRETSTTTSGFQRMCQDFSYIPKVFASLDSKNEFTFSNLGIVGGSNLDFFKAYANLALNFLEQNKHDYENKVDLINRDGINFNVIYEQGLFYYLSKAWDVNVHYLFSDDPTVPDVLNLFDCTETNKGFAHGFGSFKRSSFFCTQMEQTLKEIYPSHYHRINELLSNGEL